MLKLCTHTIGFIGFLGLALGLFGGPTFMTCGCILLSAALIAASIQSLNDSK
ncbi:MAG TPA: hypothetical protein VGI40_06390 [Pirellulaceae bacterium]|jgi:hypothetical protein